MARRKKGKLKASLEEAVSLPEVQVAVERDMEYVGKSQLVHPTTGANQLTPLSSILDKEAGNCKEGFALMASACERFGYTNVFGLSVMPKDPDTSQPGHIICVFKDEKTGKFGTAGVGTSDFFPPAFDSLEDIAHYVAFTNNWNIAEASVVELSKEKLAQLKNGTSPVDIEAKKLCNVSTFHKFGVLFGEKDFRGSVKTEEFPDGYRIVWNGLMIPAEKLEGLGDLIDGITVSEKAGRLNISIDSKTSKGSYTTTLAYYNDGDKMFNIGEHVPGSQIPTRTWYQTYDDGKFKLSNDMSDGPKVADIEKTFAAYDNMLRGLLLAFGQPQLKARFSGKSHSATPEKTESNAPIDTALQTDEAISGLMAQLGRRAQPKVTSLQPETSQYQKPKTLAELLQGINSPEEAQLRVAKAIEYVKSSDEFIYPGSEGKFNPVPAILEKGAGNCKEGFSLMAGALAKLGYEVFGLAVNPDDGEPGHVVCVYKDKKTGKMGVAGLDNGDFFPAEFEKIEDIAYRIAFSQNWNTATASVVKPNAEQLEKIINGKDAVQLGSEALQEKIDLTAKYGVRFEKEERPNGDVRNILNRDGYSIYWSGLLVLDKKMEGLGDVITGITILDDYSGPSIRIKSKTPNGSKDVNITYFVRDDKTQIEFSEHPLNSVTMLDSEYCRNAGQKNWTPNENCRKNEIPIENIDALAGQYEVMAKQFMQLLGQPQLHRMYSSTFAEMAAKEAATKSKAEA